MTITLKELEIKNFRSWNHLKLENLDSLGLTLIRGVNGSGKSSIRMALEYLLLDTIIDEIPLDEFSSGKGVELSLTLQSNSDDISIRKYRDHSQKNNSSELEINEDTSLSVSDRRLVAASIADTLKISEDVLFMSSLFSEYSPSFPSSKEGERKKLIYNVLDLKIYEELLGLVKLDLIKVEKNISKLENKQILCKERIVALKESFKKEKESLYNFENEKSRRVKKLELVLASLEEAESTSTLVIKLANLEDNLISLSGTEKLSKFIKIFLKCKNFIQDKMIYLEIHIDTLKASLEEAGKNHCPVMSKPCKVLGSEEGLLFKEELKEKIKELELKYNKLKLAEKSTKDKLSVYGDKFSFLNEEQRSLDSEFTILESYINKIDDKNDALKKRKLEVSSDIEREREAVNPYFQIQKDTLAEIKDIKKDLIQSNEDIVKERDQINLLKFWKTGFSKSGIPNIKSAGFLETLENETNQNLSLTFKGVSVKIKEQSELKSGVREKVSYEVHHPLKRIKAFKSYSAGERQRIRVADLFAFHSLVGGLNFIILDEVLELSLDDAGIESILSLLREKSKEIGTVMVITHISKTKDSVFDTIFEVSIKDGVSTLKKVK